MSHVILRHGTHEASKANLVELPALLAGSLIGNDTAAAKLARMGLGLGANSFLLKFSRDAETEADALGSHLMSEAGYDPVEMARFFEKLAARAAAAAVSFRPSEPRQPREGDPGRDADSADALVWLPDRRVPTHEVGGCGAPASP